MLFKLLNFNLLLRSPLLIPVKNIKGTHRNRANFMYKRLGFSSAVNPDPVVLDEQGMSPLELLSIHG